MELKPDEVREDSLLAGRLRLRQPVRGHRAGTDAMLLASAAPRGPGLLVDAGAGVGAAGLATGLLDPDKTIVLVERDSAIARLAAENVLLNEIGARASVVGADIFSAAARRAAGLADNAADMLISNPPFYDPATVRASPERRKSDAHVAGNDLVQPWVRAFAALLKADGRMAMIHRAEALGEILAACDGRFGALTILPVHPRFDAPAIRILVGGVKGSRAPLRLLPGLVLHEPDGRFTLQAEALHRGDARLDLT